MTARPPFRRLAWLAAVPLTPTAFGRLLDVRATAGEVRLVRMGVFVGLLVLLAAVYFAAVRLVLRHAWRRATTWRVPGVAMARRVLPPTAPPILSTPIDRYVWDGRGRADGIDPYRSLPAGPAWAALRDSSIDPAINCVDSARTLYPPVAEILFAAAGRVSDRVSGMRLIMLGFEAIGIMCLLRRLSLSGLPGERILIDAQTRLAFWSCASDGRIDAIVVGLLAAAAMAAISLHDHRYLAWLALPAVAAPSRALLWRATAPLLLTGEPVAADRFVWPSLVYVPAILQLLADRRHRIAIRQRRGPATGDASCPLQLP